MAKNYQGKYGLEESKDTNDEILNNLFNDSIAPELDKAESELEFPMLIVDLNEINGEAKQKAENITKKLSDYYFDPKYIEKHPYIKNKITQEVDSIRRLIKMLSINEKAQDTLIQTISMNCAKSAIYSSLTTLQSTMLSIQNKLDNSTAALEQIFMDMQENCEQTFEDKSKEMDDSGNMVSMGSREFIKEITASINGEKSKKEDETIVDNVTYDYDNDTINDYYNEMA